MNVLVLGGTGFIGSHVVRSLSKGDHNVTLFHRGPCDAAGHIHAPFGRLWRSEPGPPDPVPLDACSPLRTLAAPDGKPEDAFDNLEAERAALDDPALAATILRLPATHGPGDPRRRHALSAADERASAHVARSTTLRRRAR